MKKNIFLFITLGALILTLTGCSGDQKITYFNEDGSSKTVAVKDIVKPDKIEVYLFHATQRCATCIAIGRLAGETVNEYFQPELRDGKIEFREINIDLPENKELAEKFGATGSALYTNVIVKGQDAIAQDVKVWRLTTNEEAFKSYLKDKLNTQLGK
ncbi:MAG: nitrophenyl compound nitroreductase subunit ArsF family protein [Patescibacteria group bacterium]